MVIPVGHVDQSRSTKKLINLWPNSGCRLWSPMITHKVKIDQKHSTWWWNIDISNDSCGYINLKLIIYKSKAQVQKQMQTIFFMLFCTNNLYIVYERIFVIFTRNLSWYGIVTATVTGHCDWLDEHLTLVNLIYCEGVFRAVTTVTPSYSSLILWPLCHDHTVIVLTRGQHHSVRS